MFQNTYRVPMKIDQRKYKCQKCGRKFHRNTDLNQHDRHWHQGVIWDRTLCSQKLHTKDNLKRNMECFQTSSVLDEGLSVDNTLTQQTAPAGIPGDGSGVSDLIQETNVRSLVLWPSTHVLRELELLPVEINISIHTHPHVCLNLIYVVVNKFSVHIIQTYFSRAPVLNPMYMILFRCTWWLFWPR